MLSPTVARRVELISRNVRSPAYGKSKSSNQKTEVKSKLSKTRLESKSGLELYTSANIQALCGRRGMQLPVELVRESTELRKKIACMERCHANTDHGGV